MWKVVGAKCRCRELFPILIDTSTGRIQRPPLPPLTHQDQLFQLSARSVDLNASLPLAHETTLKCKHLPLAHMHLGKNHEHQVRMTGAGASH